MADYQSRRARYSKGKTGRSLSVAGENSLMETAKLFSKDLTSTEYKFWAGILSDFQDAAIVWSFDNWNRNAKWFPKPAEILELLHTFGASVQTKTNLCEKCKDGWVIVNPNAKPSDYKMRRCECFEGAVANQQAAQRLCDRSEDHT